MSHWSLAISTPVLIVGLGLWLWSGWLCYANWQRSGHRRSARRLESLRFILITLLALTLLRPEFVRHLQRTEKPAVENGPEIDPLLGAVRERHRQGVGASDAETRDPMDGMSHRLPEWFDLDGRPAGLRSATSSPETASP